MNYYSSASNYCMYHSFSNKFPEIFWLSLRPAQKTLFLPLASKNGRFLCAFSTYPQTRNQDGSHQDCVLTRPLHYHHIWLECWILHSNIANQYVYNNTPLHLAWTSTYCYLDARFLNDGKWARALNIFHQYRNWTWIGILKNRWFVVRVHQQRQTNSFYCPCL